LEIKGKPVAGFYINHDGEWIKVPLTSVLKTMVIQSNNMIEYQKELDGTYDTPSREHIDPHSYISGMSLLGRLFGWAVLVATMTLAIFVVLSVILKPYNG
jgi:hypothetical protein